MDKCHWNVADTATTLAQRLLSRDDYDVDHVAWLDKSTNKGVMNIHVEVAILENTLVRGPWFQALQGLEF